MAELVEAGYSLAELVEAGYSLAELVEAAYSLAELVEAGCSLAELVEASEDAAPPTVLTLAVRGPNGQADFEPWLRP